VSKDSVLVVSLVVLEDNEALENLLVICNAWTMMPSIYIPFLSSRSIPLISILIMNFAANDAVLIYFSNQSKIAGFLYTHLSSLLQQSWLILEGNCCLRVCWGVGICGQRHVSRYWETIGLKLKLSCCNFTISANLTSFLEPEFCNFSHLEVQNHLLAPHNWQISIQLIIFSLWIQQNCMWMCIGFETPWHALLS
jgi:hypothetical protein